MNDSDILFLSSFAYIGPFWFIGLISERRGDKALRFHINQGLILFISELLGFAAIYLLAGIVSKIPVLGELLCIALWAALAVYSVVFSAKGCLNAANGRQKPLSVFGRLTIIGSGGRRL